MNALRTCVVVTGLLVLAGCGGGSSSLFDDQAVVRSSGVALPYFAGAVASIGEDVVFLANENAQNQGDLNGDADFGDNVVQLLEPATGAVTNLGVSARGVLAGAPRYAAWPVFEQDQGLSDLSGDGDLLDSVLAVYDRTLPVGPTNPRITGVVLATNSPIRISGSTACFISSEADLVADLNGDGDTGDFIVRTYDIATGVVVNTTRAFDAGAGIFELKDGFLVFAVSEGGDNVDANGDGDTSDTVLLGHVVATGANVAIGPGGPQLRAVADRAVILTGMPSPAVAYAIDEASDAGVNRNASFGDTDTTDAIFAVWRSVGGEALPLGGLAVDADSIKGSATHVAARAKEADNGPLVDFNGDGDNGDGVLFYTTVANPVAASNLALPIPSGEASLEVCGSFVLFLVDEGAQGSTGTNYNAIFGDTDTSDQVAFFAELGAAAVVAVNTHYATAQFKCFDGEDFFFITAPESDNNGSDLNGDSDTGDIVPVYFRIVGNQVVASEEWITTDGILSFQVCPSFVRVWANVSEANFNRDLNADGDADDFVLCATRVERPDGRISSFEEIYTCDADGTGFAIQTDGDTLVFPVAEQKTGLGFNMNAGSGDTDVVDVVLHFVNTSCL